jgi:hypothetical protein
MEPVGALSSPDPLRPAARKLAKKPGRPGLASAFAVLFIPHVWIGVGLLVGSLAQIGGWLLAPLGVVEPPRGAPPLLVFALFWDGVVGVIVYTLAVIPVLRWYLMKRGVASPTGRVEHVARNDSAKQPYVEVFYSYVSAVGASLRQFGKMKVAPEIFDAEKLSDGFLVFHHPTRTRLSTIGALTSWEIVG